MTPTTKSPARGRQASAGRGRGALQASTRVEKDEDVRDAEQVSTMGRPPEGPGGASREVMLPIRITEGERAAWRALAAARGVSVAALVRDVMAAQLRRERR